LHVVANELFKFADSCSVTRELGITPSIAIKSTGIGGRIELIRRFRWKCHRCHDRYIHSSSSYVRSSSPPRRNTAISFICRERRR